MIRKNAVESILAERNILITVRNPFVVSCNITIVLGDAVCVYNVLIWIHLMVEQVRFFYSFTCRENLYLVMEYLNGGDLFSLL